MKTTFLSAVCRPRFILLCLLALSICSCLPKQQVLQNPRGSQRAGTQTAPRNQHMERKPKMIRKSMAVRSASAEDYIERFKGTAIAEMNTYGIPASITLAQALLESGNGNSALAINANNHFGIKATSDWKGKTVLQDDDYKNDIFRHYASPEESFRDHSEFLLRKRYAALFELDKDDYVGWAQGLKKAGYATNPRYAELLIDIVSRYDLHLYDVAESNTQKIAREEKVFTEIVEQLPKEEEVAQAKPPVNMSIHEVKQGDTIYSISQRYGLNVSELKAINSLQDDKLVLGQLLLVSK